MQYAKPVMRSGELEQMGFSPEYLRRAYGTKGQTFASKINPLKKNSPIIFDTEGFEAWRRQDIENQTRGMRRR